MRSRSYSSARRLRKRKHTRRRRRGGASLTAKLAQQIRNVLRLPSRKRVQEKVVAEVSSDGVPQELVVGETLGPALPPALPRKGYAERPGLGTGSKIGKSPDYSSEFTQSSDYSSDFARPSENSYEPPYGETTGYRSKPYY